MRHQFRISIHHVGIKHIQSLAQVGNTKIHPGQATSHELLFTEQTF
jgi:hypothetical protein